MEDEGSKYASAEALQKNELILFLSDAARPVLSNDEIFFEKLTILYFELLHCVKTMVENLRLDSFCKAYARYRDEFQTLLYHRLSDLEPALAELEHMVAVVERGVTLFEDMRSPWRRSGGESRWRASSCRRIEREVGHGWLRRCGIGSRGARNRRCIGPNRRHEYVCTTGGAGYSRNSPPKRCRRPLHFQSDRVAHSSLLTKNQLCGLAAKLVHDSP